MIGFQNQTTSVATTTSDPHKHVKYNLGMVLGVDEFEQEFAYLSNRDQWLARDIIGYGTVCGLKVSVETDPTDERGPRVSVEPGVAISPRGQLMRVAPAQCAYLGDWLKVHRDEVQQQLGSPVADDLPLYVLLCYRACPTDKVPIPGEPCRDESASTVDSRWQDDFKLELRFAAPDQTEENAISDFVEWLSHVEVSDAATSLPLEDFLNAIRAGAHPNSPPSSPPDFMYGLPPSGIVINRADACEYLRAAFRIWVTELRALWRGSTCDGTLPNEECVLLAELDVPLVNGEAGSMNNSNIHEEHRPYVIHLRMLQEWLLCGPLLASTSMAGSPPASPIPSPPNGGNSGLETDLTRIVALSWTHGGNTTLDLTLDGTPRKGLLVAFGKSALGDGGLARVEPGSLDHETFQIFVELFETDGGVDFWTSHRIQPDVILPVTSLIGPDGLATQASTVAGPEAMAAVLLLNDAAFKYVQNKKLSVLIKGEFVLDETEQRAIDAEFVRAELPTGDRPRGSTLGMQGGRFESWAWVGLIVNINTATVAELDALPEIGPTLAQRIINARPFTTVEELLKVSGIGPDTLIQLRPFVTVGP